MLAEETSGVAAAGDEVARLYDQYGAKLQRFCMSRLRSHEEAEDAVQTTFLRVYTALRKGSVPQYEAAWLYKIAHNVCLSRIESSGRRARHESPQDLDLLGAEMAAPTSRRDELIGLESALAEMPANMRQAILLREWQGLSYQEIAEALGVSVSAVESLIFRGRRFLANALEPAKRAAGAINLGWLLGPARSLIAGGRAAFTAAGAGTKVAAGLALLAAGTGGVGVGLSVGSSTPPKPPATTGPANAANAVAGSSAGASTSQATAAEVAAHTAGTTAAARRAARKGRASAKRGVPGAAVPTTQTPTGTTPTSATPTTPITPTTPPARPQPKPPAGTTTVGVKAPRLPTVTTPTVPAATVTVPGVTTATTPTVPPVTTPTVPTPTVTVPGVTTVKTPTVTVP